IVDNQMSNANGLHTQAICKRRMGQFEVEEYVSWKRQLCALPEFADVIDPNRVGIYGWSYGGYVSLMAMAQAPQEFKLGFAGAPVGDWMLYDTGYTERYMGVVTDDKSAAAYTAGKVSTYAAGFPDELDRLFLAHGLLDENVHFTHSCDVLNALVEYGKPYAMLVYPGERHGLRQKKPSRAHYDAVLIKTVVEKL
ncbi:MAG: prolyl oligopeptidase family serine peptidase, partial [Candidatus Micrarchaeaceae archaeon]